MDKPCRRCGSGKVIPDVPLADRFGDSGNRTRPAEFKVAGNPGAWVFRQEAVGEIYARICGDCGYTELFTGNHRELYERYRRASGAGG